MKNAVWIINRFKIFSIIDCRGKVCQLPISSTWSIKPWSAIYIIGNVLSCLFSNYRSTTYNSVVVITSLINHYVMSVTLHILHSLFSNLYHRGCRFFIWTCSNIEWPYFMMGTCRTRGRYIQCTLIPAIGLCDRDICSFWLYMLVMLNKDMWILHFWSVFQYAIGCFHFFYIYFTFFFTVFYWRSHFCVPPSRFRI